MTGRPPAPFDPPRGRMPVLQIMAPAELAIDETYQRGLEDAKSRELVKRIARTWDWDLCQPLVVARRAGEDGERFYVIDGQHRLAACRMRGDIGALPCVVVDYGGPAAEAIAFRRLNTERKTLTKLDLFRAAVAGGDPEALAISEAMADAGLAVAPHSNCSVWKPGMVSNIGGIEYSWRRDGPEATRRALAALAQGFAGQVQQYAGTLFRGIVRVCRDEIRAHGAFAGERFERFTAMLGRQPQAQWMHEARHAFAAGDALFMGEAVDTLMRERWKRSCEGGRPVQALPAPALRPVVKPAEPVGFGFAAGDDTGGVERAWCTQCDRRVTAEKAGACLSKFCPMKRVA